MGSMYVGGVLVFMLVVVVANIKVVTFSYSHYWFSVVMLVLSVLSFFIICLLLLDWLPISEFLENYESRGAIDYVFENPNSYFVFFLVVYGCFMFMPVVAVVKDFFFTMGHWRKSRKLKKQQKRDRVVSET
jgi:hypothetical protein